MESSVYKISVITLSFNSGRYLGETINSVINQDYPNIEYIIIDGGSTDGSVDVIKHFAAQDKRIRWVSEKDNGISDAMNKGISMSTGEIVAHLHSDDYYADTNILSMVSDAFVKNDLICWLTGGIHIVNANSELLTTIQVRKYDYMKLVEANTILHPSTFILRKAFDSAGFFDTSLMYAMDYDMWLRLGLIGEPLLLDLPLTCFRAHTGSVSTLKSGEAFDEAWKVRKKYLRSNPLRFMYCYFKYRTSRKACILFNEKLLNGMV